MSLRPRVPVALQLPMYADAVEEARGHEAPRLPTRASCLFRTILAVVVLGCCGVAMLCATFAVMVGGSRLEARSALFTNAPLVAHAQLTLDTTAPSPPPPATGATTLPPRVVSRLRRVRELEILSGSLTDESLRLVFPDWWSADGAFRASVAMGEIVATLAHLGVPTPTASS